MGLRCLRIARTGFICSSDKEAGDLEDSVPENYLSAQG